MFYSIWYENGRLAASNRFYMFTQSVKFCTFHYDVFKSTDAWKMWLYQIDSQNEWLLLSASFTTKFGLVFLRGVILKPTEKV